MYAFNAFEVLSLRFRGFQHLFRGRAHLGIRITDVIANLHGDALLGALFSAGTATGACIGNVMRMTNFAGNSLELASTLAHAAANANILVDHSLLAVIPIGRQSARGANLSAHHAAAALFTVNHRQIVHHGDCAKLAGLLATGATDATDLAVVRHQLTALSGTATELHRLLHGQKLQHMLGASGNALAAALALFFIDHSDLPLLIDVNSAEGAGTGASAQTQAGILAHTIAVVDQ